MPFRVSLLIQLATEPVVATDASVHVAGWSEGFWQATNTDINAKINRLAIGRARMLPSQGAIIGYRVQEYTLSGTKPIPGPSSSTRNRWAGNSGYSCDQPQVALRFGMLTANGLNKANVTLRGIPDNQIVGGEYSPTQAFLTAIQDYGGLLQQDAWSMVGKNLGAPTFNVVSIANGALRVAAPIVGAVANVTWIQMVRVNDVGGAPITGRYLITAIDLNTNTYTLQGLAGAANAGGTVRVDGLALVALMKPPIVRPRASVRKVGRPFEQYRGRASRRKVGA